MKRPLDHALALALAAMGFYLFPIRPGSRTPATRHGHKQATVDPARITAWWKREPHYDLAIVCGRLLVVDIDGEVGEASLKKLEAAFGALPKNTPQVKTKRGRHIYLTVPRPTSTRLSTLGKGIDWKCHGGWVVAPPSKHKSGARYRWAIAPWEARVQPAPEWLVEALGAPGVEIPMSRAKEIVSAMRPRSPRTRVVHKNFPHDIYIGRPSIWGNPFSHLPNTLAKFRVSTRTEAIASYDQWVRSQSHLMARVHELYGKTLGCWCKPLACHGDVLARLAEEQRRARQGNLQGARSAVPHPQTMPLKKTPAARALYVDPDPEERHDASKADIAYACHRVREGALDEEIAEELYERPKCQGIGVTLDGSARVPPRNVDAYVADVIRGAHKLTRLVGASVVKWVREIYGGGQLRRFGRFRVLVQTDDGEVVVTDVVAPTQGYAGAAKRWRACFGGLEPDAIFRLSQTECGALFEDRFVVRVEGGSVALMANVKNVRG
jgi:hypothetical protein